MDNSNTSNKVLSHDYTQKELNSYHGPIAILWDIKNCPVPNDVCPEDVTGNIRTALRVHPVIKGGITGFSAYGDFNAFPRRLREGCQRTGVKLVDVPNGRKDAADKAILIDMFLFALDSPPPSSIMLISGDIDFAPALHVLGQRGYNMILVTPSNVTVSFALSSASRFVWDWPSLARGEGFVPPSKDINIEEEAILYKGKSQDFEMSLSHCNDVSITSEPSNNELIWARPGDVNGLKSQFVQMLEMSGGSIPFKSFPNEYQKLHNKPLRVAEYGVSKLVILLSKMSDVIGVDEKGKGKNSRLVYLLKSGKCPEFFKMRERRGNLLLKVLEEQERAKEKFDMELKENLDNFKCELQEILVSYLCWISFDGFEEIYQQKYKKSLEYRRFGVKELGELLDMIKDVVVLQEEPITKKKFLVAIGG